MSSAAPNEGANLAGDLRRGAPKRAAVFASSLRLVRAVLMREFLARLEERGESHVTAAAVEAFVREKLVRLVVARVETQVGAVHWGVAAVSAVAVLGPYLDLLLVG